MKTADANKAAKKAGIEGRISTVDIRALASNGQEVCCYCATDLSYKPGKREIWSVDHFIPMSKNGPNEVSNLRKCCPGCNIAKRDKLPTEFLSSL
jgi:5-methylcytosine-specific restriction endonuclease McrA